MTKIQSENIEIQLSEIAHHLLKTEISSVDISRKYKLCYNDSKELGLQNHYVKILLRLFPTVFKKSLYILKEKSNILDLIKLKTSVVKYNKSERGEITLESANFSMLSLQIQLVLQIIESGKYCVNLNSSLLKFLNENNYWIQSLFSIKSDLKAPLKSNTTLWLEKNLGNNFSYGEMLDFSDRLFDQYKHTNISPGSFFILFSSFGIYVDEIGSLAFDFYMNSRNTSEAWQKAIIQFSKEHMNLEERYSIRLSHLLIH